MASTSIDPHSTPAAAYARHESARPTHIGRVYTIGVLLLIFAAFLTYCIINYGTGSFQNTDQKRVVERQKILADRLAEDTKLLNDQPSWFKKDKQLVRVPINTAMEMTIAELSMIKPHTTDVPVTAQAPAGAPTSPDKGVASPTGGQANPPASQPVPSAPGAPAPPATPAVAPSPAGAVAPGSAGPGTAPGGATLPVGTPTPAPSVAPAPQAAPVAPAGAPVPGVSASPTPAQGSNSVAPSTPAPSPSSPALDPSQPGATPGGTPR